MYLKQIDSCPSYLASNFRDRLGFEKIAVNLEESIVGVECMILDKLGKMVCGWLREKVDNDDIPVVTEGHGLC